jgi:SAM-dependent methyltransferase
MIEPHSQEWYDRLSQQQEGYYYPWQSTLAPLNGEDEYLQLVRHLLNPQMGVLDVGCGHGEVPMQFAPLCRWIVAYDSTPAYIDMARKTAAAQQLNNISFIQAGSLSELLAAPDLAANLRQFDLIISRRGPLNWVERVRMVSKSGTILFVLNPKESKLPVWNEWLPETLRLANPRTYSRQQSVERRLALAGLALHCAWSFDVPEYLTTPEDLYVKLNWGRAPGEAPAFAVVVPVLERIFAEFGSPHGLAVPHGRFMWQAVVD